MWPMHPGAVVALGSSPLRGLASGRNSRSAIYNGCVADDPMVQSRGTVTSRAHVMVGGMASCWRLWSFDWSCMDITDT